MVPWLAYENRFIDSSQADEVGVSPAMENNQCLQIAKWSFRSCRKVSQLLVGH